MDQYELYAFKKLKRWKKELTKRPGVFAKTTKAIQSKINQAIPDSAQKTITKTVKGIVQTTLVGVQYIPKGKPLFGLSLFERDEKAKELISKYKKIAAAEGAGTGAGGIFLGLLDFPALIAIKMKFLFELAHVYGFNTKDYQERLFLLHVFQLAFSSQGKRGELLQRLEHWDEYVKTFPSKAQYLETIDWDEFQQEYRDSLDLRKLLQLLPGIGAVVGAWANYGLLDDLGETAMYCYHMRLLPRNIVI